MAMTDMLTKCFKKYCSIETVILCCFVVVIYNYLFNAENVWDFVHKIIATIVALKLKYMYNDVPRSDSELLYEMEDKAFWNLERGNARVYAIQGRRPYMEDRFNVVNDIQDTNTSIYGIFDGHGGQFASDFTEKTLFKLLMVKLLESQLKDDNISPSEILTEEILKVDEALLNIERRTSEISGTTALVAMLRKNVLTVANVGDSRGVLCDQQGATVPLSFDHKPEQLRERTRIERAGGFISYFGVWRVAGILATSRALGDLPLKNPKLVIADPDILTFNFNEINPQFIILATDGLWDVFSNEEAVSFIKQRLHESDFGAKSLVQQAYSRGSSDNITVMVVNFSNQIHKTLQNAEAGDDW